MKLSLISFMMILFALVIGISAVSMFEYSTTYKAIAFDARHALMESAKKATEPIWESELIACDEDELEDEEACPYDGYKERQYMRYMDEDEFFNCLMDYLKEAKRLNDNYEIKSELLVYENNPFLAKIRISTNLNGVFMKRHLSVEEAVIET